MLTERYGKEVRLGDYFDFIGGTSTGAIIAGALALGYRTEQVKDFYVRLAPSAFKGSRWRIPVLQAKFDASGLRTQIEAVVGNRVLKSTDLITGYCLITKRMDTGSPWIIANNPRAPYWKSSGHGEIGNEDYPLVNLVRASTAAPHFFDPELLPISQNETLLPDAVAKPLKMSPARAIYALLERFGLRHPAKIDSKNYGLFVDGGVTPHNNPSLALFQMATLKPYKIEWPTGPDNLTIMSVGTGTYRPRLSYQNSGLCPVHQAGLPRADLDDERRRGAGHGADAMDGRMPCAMGDQLRGRHACRRRPAGRQAIPVSPVRRPAGKRVAGARTRLPRHR